MTGRASRSDKASGGASCSGAEARFYTRFGLRKALRIALTVAATLLIWEGFVLLTGLPAFLLPGPTKVAQALWTSRTELAQAAGVTALEVLMGFGLGAALGAALAVIMALSAAIRETMRPILLFTQTIPVFALAPILTLWLGYGLAPKVAVTMLITFFPVASAFLDGLTRTPSAYLDLARTMGATKWREMSRVRIPAALPSLGTGLRLAAVYAPVGAVIGEWVGGAKGLGALMIHANGRMKVDLVFAALLVLAVMTVIFFRLVDRLLIARLMRDGRP